MNQQLFSKYNPIILIQQISIMILFTMLVSGCKDYGPPIPTKLPDVTNIGANTFGCYIENEIYIPEYRRITFEMPGPVLFYFPILPKYILSISTSRIVNKRDPFKDASVKFSIENVRDTGMFNLNDGVVEYEGINYYTDSINYGKINITNVDSVKKIISGTFYFKAKDQYSDKIITITNGRFDFNKNTLP
ncbi:MAG: DUF6252 family protein [Paludibacter sp.]